MPPNMPAPPPAPLCFGRKVGDLPPILSPTVTRLHRAGVASPGACLKPENQAVSGYIWGDETHWSELKAGAGGGPLTPDPESEK